MEKLVNQSVINNANELQGLFTSAQPFGHIAIDGFLEPAFAKSLLNGFPVFDKKLAINENGEVGAKAVHEKITGLGPHWRHLNKLVQNNEFRSLISNITGVAELQFDPHYFG